MMRAFWRWVCRRAGEPAPIDRDEIAARYREHDRNIARQREAIKKVDYVEGAIRRRIGTGAWSADLITGAYRPRPSQEEEDQGD